MLNPLNAPLEIPALHELEMVSPWFDSSAPQSPTRAEIQYNAEPTTRKLLIIFSIPRCGSYHLCRLLWHLGYGRPAEYFNPSLQPLLARFEPKAKLFHQRTLRRIKQRLKYPVPRLEWLGSLVKERTSRSTITGIPWFATKLQPDQLGDLHRALSRVFEPLAYKGYWETFKTTPPALVMLYRHNWKAMVISHHLARCTGSFDQRRIFTHQHRSITQLGSERALIEDLASARRHLEALTRTLEASAYPIHLISFEHLLAMQNQALESVIHAIDKAANNISDLENRPELQFRIARTTDPWASEHSTWQRHLYSRFEELNLHGTPDALACQDSIQTLNSFSHF